MGIIDRTAEGLDDPTVGSWDSIWTPWDPETGNGGFADWAVADASEIMRNRGGFKSQDSLGTAILICLFTDRRRPEDVASPDGSTDRRGWHGDSYDVETSEGERELGSLLWTLQRERLTIEDLRLVEHYASDALQTLVDQGVVDHFEIRAEKDSVAGRVSMLINAFSPTGERLYENNFPLQ